MVYKAQAKIFVFVIVLCSQLLSLSQTHFKGNKMEIVQEHNNARLLLNNVLVRFK